jgi:hypothetical protein
MQLLKRKKQLKSLIANTKAVVILAVAALLLSGVFYLNAKFEVNREQTDKQTFCRAGNMPEIVAVIVDHTDKFTPVQHEALRRYLRDTALGVQKNGMVQLYDVDSVSKSVLQPKFFLCNPGDENDFENTLARRASTVRWNYEETFVKKLDAVLNELLTAKAADQSPIMESIQSVAVTAFAGKDRASAKKTFIIVSDMLQYTKDVSLYNKVPDFEAFKKTLSWRNIHSDMRGVTVKVLYIRRDHGQSKDLLSFWQKYFEEQGAIFQTPELM